MLNPKLCVINPNTTAEHLKVINGDVKECELCGQLWIFKGNLWVAKGK